MIDGSVHGIFGPFMSLSSVHMLPFIPFLLGLFDQSLPLIPVPRQPTLKKQKEVNGSTATERWIPSIQASDGQSDPAKSCRAVRRSGGRGHP